MKLFLGIIALLLTATAFAEEHAQPALSPADAARLLKIDEKLRKSESIRLLDKIGVKASLPNIAVTPEERAWYDVHITAVNGLSDDRVEVCDVRSNAKLNVNISATAAMIPRWRIEPFVPAQGKDDWGLHAFTLNADQAPLCTGGAAFPDQTVAASCSAFLVASQLVATASHCIDRSGTELGPGLRDILFVFGYSCKPGGKFADRFSLCDIYQGIRVVNEFNLTTGNDWALVLLDRAVAGRTPVTLAATAAPVGTPLYMIGYPLGLPEKYVGGGKVVSRTDGAHKFETDLDAFNGNSGSPVFDASNNVIGILLSAGGDFEQVPTDGDPHHNCWREKHCVEPICKSSVMDIDQLPHPSTVAPPTSCP